MKTVCKENLCNACTACSVICPKKCINIVTTIRSTNAIIDINKCIDCNLCKKVCPQINEIDKISINEGYYMYSKNEDIRKKSSSGGIATLLTNNFINEHNYVTGVIFQPETKDFEMELFNNYSSNQFRGSKYVKANLNNVYKDIIEKLINDKKVLFIGTPCQVAGIINLAKYKKCDKNLFTVDLICHGTPSQEIFDKFISQYNIDIGKVERINFRNHHVMQISFNDFETLEKYKVMDTYMIGFLNSLFYTDNCYECQFASSQRCSDITIGDAWGNDEVVNGMSLVLINTSKGRELFRLISSDCYIEKADISKSIKNNGQLAFPSIKPIKQRESFYKNYYKRSFNSNIALLYPKIYLKQQIKKIIYRRIS